MPLRHSEDDDEGINDVAFVKWGYKTNFFFCFSYWCNCKVWKIIANNV